MISDHIINALALLGPPLWHIVCYCESYHRVWIVYIVEIMFR